MGALGRLPKLVISAVVGGAAMMLACGEPSVPVANKPTPAPSPAATANQRNAPWPLDLTLSGEVIGGVTATLPRDGTAQSECTGRNSRNGGTWAGTFLIDVGGRQLALVVVVPGYSASGTFTSVSAELHNRGAMTSSWRNTGSDAASFTVGGDEESGSLDLALTNLTDLQGKIHVTGTWTCRS